MEGGITPDWCQTHWNVKCRARSSRAYFWPILELLFGYISNAKKYPFFPIFNLQSSEENSQFYLVVNDRNPIIVKGGLKLFVQHVKYSTLHSLISHDAMVIIS